MKIEEILGSNVVYHSVLNGSTAEKILNSGIIKPNISDADKDAGWKRKVISSSRDQFYRFPYGDGLVQFVLDVNALKSAGFKVEPFSYNRFYQPKKDNPITGDILHKQESEERIYHPKGIGIPAKLPYVIEIQIHPSIFDKIPQSFINTVKSLNIPIAPMKNFINSRPENRIKKSKRTNVSNNPNDWKVIHFKKWGITKSLSNDVFEMGRKLILTGVNGRKTAEKYLQNIQILYNKDKKSIWPYIKQLQNKIDDAWNKKMELYNNPNNWIIMPSHFNQNEFRFMNKGGRSPVLDINKTYHSKEEAEADLAKFQKEYNQSKSISS